MRVHFLTEGFRSPNGRAFLFPILRHQSMLREAGFEIEWHSVIHPRLQDCDVLAIDSKFFRLWWIPRREQALEQFARFRDIVKKIVFFDLGDSTGWLQSQVLPYVDRYCKAQLLRDRALYMRPMHDSRIYTDYYHEHFGIQASKENWAIPPDNPDHLKKLEVSWNSGLADYSYLGPYLMALYQRIPVKALLRAPKILSLAGGPRSLDVAGRFGISYREPVVRYQREQIRNQLARRNLPTGKLSRREYFAEMIAAKVVVSPFGYGEITLKDFEAFLCGAVILKPDISHMETWPDFFECDGTVVCHRWDLADFEERLEAVLHGYERCYVDIARQGQERYVRYAASDYGAQAFCERFIKIIRGEVLCRVND